MDYENPADLFEQIRQSMKEMGLADPVIANVDGHEIQTSNITQYTSSYWQKVFEVLCQDELPISLSTVPSKVIDKTRMTSSPSMRPTGGNSLQS